MAFSLLSLSLRHRRLSSVSSVLSQFLTTNHLTLTPSPQSPFSTLVDTNRPHCYRIPLNSFAVGGAFSSRAFSASSFPDNDDDVDILNGIDEVAADVSDVSDSIFPVKAVMSMLDGFHDLTGLPWSVLSL